MKTNIERRVLRGDGIEIRKAAKSVDGPGTLCGYAATYGSVAKMRGFNEVLAPGAFKRVVADPNLDCRFLWNHNSDAVLGRTKAGTLRLTEDGKGLRYSVDLPDTTAARDLYTSVERGDVSGCSFQFTVAPDDQTWTETREGVLRTIKSVHELLDVSAVAYPAYADGTSIEARHAAEAGMPAHIQRQFEHVIELRRNSRGKDVLLWQSPQARRDCPVGHEVIFLPRGAAEKYFNASILRRKTLLDLMLQ